MSAGTSNQNTYAGKSYWRDEDFHQGRNSRKLRQKVAWHHSIIENDEDKHRQESVRQRKVRYFLSIYFELLIQFYDLFLSELRNKEDELINSTAPYYFDVTKQREPSSFFSTRDVLVLSSLFSTYPLKKSLEIPLHSSFFENHRSQARFFPVCPQEDPLLVSQKEGFVLSISCNSSILKLYTGFRSERFCSKGFRTNLFPSSCEKSSAQKVL